METGELGPGVAFPRDGKMVWHDVHPESGARLAGNRVPHWGVIKERILRAVALFPMLPYVGWDVIVTEEGFSVVEGNFRSGMRSIQSSRPLLLDERIRRFYIESGTLSKRRARRVEAWIRKHGEGSGGVLDRQRA